MNTNEIQNVLWLQSESPLTADLLLINGESPSSNEERSEVFVWLTSDRSTTAPIKNIKRAKWRVPSGWKKHKEEYLSQGISNNLTLLERKLFILIQACVFDTDELGRKRPYIYCTRLPESKSISEILNKWAKCIHSIHASFNENDMICIRHFLQNRARNSKKKIISIAILLLFLAIIVFIILFFSVDSIHNSILRLYGELFR